MLEIMFHTISTVYFHVNVLRILSAYIHVSDVARGHDYMDVGGRAMPGAIAEESEATVLG
jgi:hypothetical protein